MIVFINYANAPVSSLPSVVNAIDDATGIWFKELPIAPEKVVKALENEGG
jgi:CO/xanthine dehydrogenase Mo-binding subunit